MSKKKSNNPPELRGKLNALDLADEWTEMMVHLTESARFSETCCDDPEDRMWHAADNTWWRRDGMCWVASAPPKGWKRNG